MKNYTLLNSQVKEFQNNGFIKLDNILNDTEIKHYKNVINNAAKINNTENRILEDRDTYGKAFLQITNLWQKDEQVKEFSLSKSLADIAAKLLGVDKVRIYHDQALFKEAGGGYTPWHQDQYYWPLDTNKTVTMWMPLVDLTEDMGILQFAEESHASGLVKSVAISNDSHKYLEEYIHSKNYRVTNIKKIDAGDATFHNGWTLHYAPGNKSNKPRDIMTIIYYADDANIIEPDNEHRKVDLESWFPGLKPGDKAASILNPVVN